MLGLASFYPLASLFFIACRGMTFPFPPLSAFRRHRVVIGSRILFPFPKARYTRFSLVKVFLEVDTTLNTK